MLRIRDNLIYRDRLSFPDPAGPDQAAIQASFVVTSEARTACSRILGRLATYHHKQPSAFLFTGAPGVGKTHLLRFMQGLLADPSGSGWEKLLPFPEGSRRPPAPQQSCFLDIPADPSADLGQALLRQVLESSGQDPLVAAGGMASLTDFSKRLSDAAPLLLSRNLAFIALEGLSQRIDGLASRESIEDEIRLLRTLAEIAAESGTLVFFVADDRHLQSNGKTSALPPLKNLAQFCDLIWLSRGNIAEIVSTMLAPKNRAQRAEILRILESLRKKLPLFGHKDESFSDLYPIHPQVFNALFDLRAVLPGFSILEFAQAAIKASLDLPAERLVGSDELFDHVLPELRKRPRFVNLLRAYDELQRRALPHLNPRSRPRAACLLKGIALGSICPSISGTVKNLANGLLLFDDSDVSPGYSMAAGILLELEQRSGSLLIVEGERLDRTYRLPSHRDDQPGIIDAPLTAATASDEVSGTPAEMPHIIRVAPPQKLKSAEEDALNWAALLSGLDDLRDADCPTADRRLRSWWASFLEHETDKLSGKLHPLPEAISTRRLWKSVRSYEQTLELLKPTMLRWLSGELSFVAAMAQLRHDFGDDPDAPVSWRKSLENLRALMRWVPSFEHAREYVSDAFSLGDEQVDDLRTRLLAWIEEPNTLLEADQREAFDLAFREFRLLYAAHYSSLHEEALNVVGGGNRRDTKVDPTALRNLEALSGLRFTDQSFLHRVRLIGKWLQRNQCTLPVKEILEHQARCLCNFNPERDRHLTQAAGQIQNVVLEGVEYFRSVLQQCSRIIMEDLKEMDADETCSGQIAALLGRGPLMPLAAKTIDVLNGIIAKHAAEFLSIARPHKS
jgi:hypothetical protein